MHLPAIFSDRMVIQRNKPFAVWGRSGPGADVTITIGEHPAVSTTADGHGFWRLEHPPLSTARDLRVTISDGDEDRVLEDVAVGEVWIAAGQSNMEFQLELDADRDEVLAGALPADVRSFEVPQISYHGQDRDHEYRLAGFWRGTTPEDVRYFSAVAFFFAARLQEDVDVPIGIVACNWGGTPASAWADPGRLAVGPAAVWLDDYAEGLRGLDVQAEAELFRAHSMSDRTDPFADPLLYRFLRDGFTEEEAAAFLGEAMTRFLPTIGLLHPNRPGGLVDTMVRTIAGYAARGVLWYQGESDAPHASAYGAALTAVIETWRDLWGDDGLAFLVAQLAPFGHAMGSNGDDFPIVREQQALVAATVPHVWLASTSDAGHPTDIHPKRKRPVGERLALLALAHVYGHRLLGDAPTLSSVRRGDAELRFTFEHVDERGLEQDGSDLPLAVADASGAPVEHWEATVDGDAIVLRGDVPLGATVAFAWTGYSVVGVRNAAGIPALPFRRTV